MALLKILLLLGLGVSENSAVSLQKRIIGGQNCDDRERLYHVRLERIKGDERIRCGGSLIHPQWILTSADCWKSETGWSNVAKLKVHPRTVIQYNQVIRRAPLIYKEKHNLMLVKLDTPVTDVPLAQLPDCSYRLKKGDTVKLAGEGATTTGPNYERLINPAIPSHLQCVDMKVLIESLLVPSHGHAFYAEARNKDICFGDTGGAVIYNDMIYGVIAFIGQNRACQTPTAILDVCKYIVWIRGHLGLQ